jgi:hypothetical protein
MAPKSLLKTLKYKPQTQLNMDDVVNPDAEVIVFGQAPRASLPEPTVHELVTWADARALQKNLPNGQPAEGWAARVNAMKLDGRLVKMDGLWYRR